MATIGEIAVADPASSANPQVEVITVANTGANPGANQAGRQVCSLGDGGGGANYQTVDADGVARIVAGRSGTASIISKGTIASAITLVSANSLRLNLFINNQSSNTMYVSTSASLTGGPAGTNVLSTIPPGSSWNMLNAWGVIFTGIVYGVWDANDSSHAVISEFSA